MIIGWVKVEYFICSQGKPNRSGKRVINFYFIYLLVNMFNVNDSELLEGEKISPSISLFYK